LQRPTYQQTIWARQVNPSNLSHIAAK
jgi:hypothetical protein